MDKLHLCAGDVYLTGYINCDHDGYLLQPTGEAVHRTYDHEYKLIRTDTLRFSDGKNPNETTLENYFKHPFVEDSSKRQRREFIIDEQMNILGVWPWADSIVDEIIMVSAFEHFEHIREIPNIIEQAHRVLVPGGVWKFDFPDIKKTVDENYGWNDEYMMELIFCNRKNKYSVHCWSYTPVTIQKYLTKDKWSLEFKDVVQHSYPMQGVWATKVVK